MGHDCARNARGAHAARSPGPLVRLERREGRRLLPIVMVVKLALHHRQRACATRRAISGREGQCMGRHGPLRALEQGFSAGGQRGLPGRSKRGAVALRGAKGLSSPLCGEGAYLRFRSGLFYIVDEGDGVDSLTPNRGFPPHGQSIPRLWGRAGMTTSTELVTQPLHMGPWLTRARRPVLAGDSPRSLSSRLGPHQHSDALWAPGRS